MLNILPSSTCSTTSCLFLSAHVPKLNNVTAILPIVSYTIYFILADTFPKLFKVTCTCLIVLVWTIEPQNLKSSSFKSSIPSNFTMPLLFLTSTFMQSSLLQQTFTWHLLRSGHHLFWFSSTFSHYKMSSAKIMIHEDSCHTSSVHLPIIIEAM